MTTDLVLCGLSHKAYSDTNPTWERDDIQVYRTDMDGHTVVAFRGSSDAEDWLRDLKGWPKRDRQLGFGHSGFLEGAHSVSGQIMQDVAGDNVIITGHSLGGALALILGALMTVSGHQPISVVTFGAPRPGFGKMSRIIRTIPRVVEYRNGGDPVPQVPMWLPWWPYQHPVGLTQLGKPDLIDIEDHKMDRYETALSAYPAALV